MGFIGSMLSPSGGAGHQASVNGTGAPEQEEAFQNTQAGIKQQQDFVNALNQQNGLANQSAVFGQQQGLANQLQGLANGVGPNPAQAQLAQNTASNTANQAALMAGQRGSSQNTGMMARQAAQQGAQNQQQSVGQAATLSAQQQLAAMQQLQNQQASMGNMANTQVGQLQSGIQGLNQASLQQQGNLLGAQANQNNVNAGIAGGNQSGQQNIMSGLMGGAGAAMSMMADGGQVSQAGAMNPLMQPVGSQQVTQVDTSGAGSGPQSNVGKIMSGMQGASSQSSAKAQQTGADLVNGAHNMYSSLTSTPGDSGVPMGEETAFTSEPAVSGGLTSESAGLLGAEGESLGAGELAGGAADAIGSAGLGEAAAGIGEGIAAAAPELLAGLEEAAPLVLAAARGGKVPALVSPGERYLSPNKVNAVAHGKANPIKDGKKVPGKPKVAGAMNSYSNDTVKTTLEEGGIVIPRSITMSKNPEKNAIAFVRDVLAKNGHLPKKSR